MEGRLEVTAISVHAYAYVSKHYRLLPHGASMGEKYGPMVVAREELDPAQLPSLRVAVPGAWTSAFLELQLAVGRIAEPVITPFDEILDVVAEGKVDAGLVIHEGQLTYASQGLVNILDLGLWWDELTGGLPLPLGANAVRRDVGDDATLRRLSHLLRDSIAYALDHRKPALEHAEQFGRGLDMELADRFVGMYVNERTLDYGEDGRAAIDELLRRGAEAGLLERPGPGRLHRGLTRAGTRLGRRNRSVDRALPRCPEPAGAVRTCAPRGLGPGHARAIGRRRPDVRRADERIRVPGRRGRMGPRALRCQLGSCGVCEKYVGKAYSLRGEHPQLPPPPPLPICPACRHTLNLMTPFFMQSTGMDIDDLAAEAQPFEDDWR